MVAHNAPLQTNSSLDRSFGLILGTGLLIGFGGAVV